MRHHSEFLMMPIVMFVILLFFQSASAQYAIPRSVFGSGGASLSSSTNKLVGTLGQPLIGTMSGTSNRHFAGFWYLQGYQLTSVEEKPAEELPVEYQLQQNYPNPFNPTTTIEYDLPSASRVELRLYDILGHEVTTLVNEKQTAGHHSLRFDASGLASGVYFYRLRAGEFTQTRRMLLLR
jgi:hypothetical protein